MNRAWTNPRGKKTSTRSRGGNWKDCRNHSAKKLSHGGHRETLKEQDQLAVFCLSEPALSAAEECVCGGGLKTTAQRFGLRNS
jgi:hypothetical protein